MGIKFEFLKLFLIVPIFVHRGRQHQALTEGERQRKTAEIEILIDRRTDRQRDRQTEMRKERETERQRQKKIKIVFFYTLLSMYYICAKHPFWLNILYIYV